MERPIGGRARVTGPERFAEPSERGALIGSERRKGPTRGRNQGDSKNRGNQKKQTAPRPFRHHSRTPDRRPGISSGRVVVFTENVSLRSKMPIRPTVSSASPAGREPRGVVPHVPS